MPDGSSVKDLLRRFDIPESELRETLRRLDAAGLARRMKGTWRAVPLQTAEAGTEEPEAAASSLPEE